MFASNAFVLLSVLTLTLTAVVPFIGSNNKKGD